MKWVQVDLGKSIALDRIVLWGCHDDFNMIGAGFGFPVRFKIEVSDDPKFQSGVVLIADQTSADVPNPGVAAQSFAAKAAKGRYIRVTATKLASRQNDYIFALAELEAFDAAGNNVALGAAVTRARFDRGAGPLAKDEPDRWLRSRTSEQKRPREAAKRAKCIDRARH